MNTITVTVKKEGDQELPASRSEIIHVTSIVKAVENVDDSTDTDIWLRQPGGSGFPRVITVEETLAALQTEIATAES